MPKRIFLIVLIYTGCIQSIQAQWTEKDSLRLQQILSGKEKLEMNPEALRAIRSGSLLDRDEPVSGMKSKENPLPILKDFTEYLKVDTPAPKVAWTDLPPAVFKLYGPPTLPELRVYLSIKKRLKPSLTPSAGLPGQDSEKCSAGKYGYINEMRNETGPGKTIIGCLHRK